MADVDFDRNRDWQDDAVFIQFCKRLSPTARSFCQYIAVIVGDREFDAANGIIFLKSGFQFYVADIFLCDEEGDVLAVQGSYNCRNDGRALTEILYIDVNQIEAVENNLFGGGRRSANG